MNIRSIFLNKSNDLRAGWRIAIFLLLQVPLSVGILGIVRLGLPYLGVSASIYGTILTAVGYIILIGTTFVVLRLVEHRPFHSGGLQGHPLLSI